MDDFSYNSDGGDGYYIPPELAAEVTPQPTSYTAFGDSAYAPASDFGGQGTYNFTNPGGSDFGSPGAYASPGYSVPDTQYDVAQQGVEASPLAAVAAKLQQSSGQVNPTNTDYDTLGNPQQDPQGPRAAPSEGALSQIMKSLGLGGKLSDPKTMESFMKLLIGGGSLLSTLSRKGTSQNALTPQQAVATLPFQAANKFNPVQQASSDTYFNSPSPQWHQRATISAANMASPIVPGKRYAEGGEVDAGALSQVMGPSEGTPFTGFVQGPGGGQADLVDAKLAAGEYVFDADVVSAIGDGDNAHGAELLDQFRENLRAHKRSADPSSIPPPTGDPSQFMPKGALEQMMGGQ